MSSVVPFHRVARRPPARSRTYQLAVAIVMLLLLAVVLVSVRTPSDGVATPVDPAAHAQPATPAAAPAPEPATVSAPEPAQQPVQVAAPAGGSGPTIKASPEAFSDIPPDYLGLYVQAADTCPDLSWQLLAGVGKVETRHGQSDAPGVKRGVNAFGCCAGPMQFNVANGPPSTWDGLKADYNGDGKILVHDPGDAIPAAARKLCDNGINPTEDNRKWKGMLDADPCPDVRGTPAEHRALRRYNNACWYASEVLNHAARYTQTQTPAQLAADPFLQKLLANPNITTTSDRGCDPQPDLESGKLDLRVQSLLSVLAQDYKIQLSCAKTGHSRNVKGTNRVSNHTVWRAVDINVVDGHPVRDQHPSARALVDWLDRLQGPLRPSEVGSPFRSDGMYFEDGGHQGHIHIGYGSNN